MITDTVLLLMLRITLREITQEMEETGDLSTEKPVSIAIDKMAAEIDEKND